MSEKTELLKELYEQVEDKKAFREEVAEAFHIKASSVRVNWFSNRFEVPERYGILDRVIDFTSAYIDNQNKQATVDHD